MVLIKFGSELRGQGLKSVYSPGANRCDVKTFMLTSIPIFDPAVVLTYEYIKCKFGSGKESSTNSLW